MLGAAPPVSPSSSSVVSCCYTRRVARPSILDSRGDVGWWASCCAVYVGDGSVVVGGLVPGYFQLTLGLRAIAVVGLVVVGPSVCVLHFPGVVSVAT